MRKNPLQFSDFEFFVTFFGFLLFLSFFENWSQVLSGKAPASWWGIREFELYSDWPRQS
jgi:hypothetical protein